MYRDLWRVRALAGISLVALAGLSFEFLPRGTSVDRTRLVAGPSTAAAGVLIAPLILALGCDSWCQPAPSPIWGTSTRRPSPCSRP